MRKEDKGNRSFKRSERFYEKETGWYFFIRQGASFGPYESKQHAQKHLNSFITLLVR